MNLTKAAEDLIVDLAESLEIPPERYVSADRSYQSLASWLERPGSRFEHRTARVYTQGSFRLGTVIRPLNGEEHYDLDVVCEFEVNKSQSSQQLLQTELGLELKAYAASHSMEQPDQWDRCWTLNYADSAQFHMDVLPSTPDGIKRMQILAAQNLSNAFTAKSVAITDRKDPYYLQISDEWPTSNPDGYAEWFLLKMKPLLEKRSKVAAIFAEADVADIPRFRDKTPLQSAIQILKRHRDIKFSETPELRPSSIIITTLATHAYSQEERVSDALYSILARFDSAITVGFAGVRIENPTNPTENFADSWAANPERQTAFFDWIASVRSDFYSAAQIDDIDQLVADLAPRMGRQLVEKAASMRPKAAPQNGALTPTSSSVTGLQLVETAIHRKLPPWPLRLGGFAEIISATQSLPGFRAGQIGRSGNPVRSGAQLQFAVKTNVPKPYQAFWQIVNTGEAATQAGDLRGDFYEDRFELGYLTRKERAKYPGLHSVECFIVKDGRCVARTSPFIVHIQR